jgi:MoxR-like ATPase
MKVNPLFFTFATANTMGFGDETGNYSGTQKQNSATMSRFIKCKVDYLPPHLETPMVASKFLKLYDPDNAKDPKTKAFYQEITQSFVEHNFAGKLVELANATRNMHIKDPGTIETPLSTRELVAIACNYPVYQNVSNALALSIYNSYSAQLPEPSRAWLEEVSARIFGNNMKAEYASKPVEAPRGFKIKA